VRLIRGVAIGLVPIVSMSLVQAAIAKRGVQRFAENGWMVSIKYDAFAQTTRCSLTSKTGRILYQPAAVGFRFAHAEDTLNAVYRIDGAAPQRWQDSYPSLIAAGAQIDGAGLAKPTNGIVWLPIAEVVPAHMVSIRLRKRGKVRLFALAGFAAMLATSRRLGCATDASFAS